MEKIDDLKSSFQTLQMNFQNTQMAVLDIKGDVKALEAKLEKYNDTLFEPREGLIFKMERRISSMSSFQKASLVLYGSSITILSALVVLHV